jgi:hypothetical protein
MATSTSRLAETTRLALCHAALLSKVATYMYLASRRPAPFDRLVTYPQIRWPFSPIRSLTAWELFFDSKTMGRPEEPVS